MSVEAFDPNCFELAEYFLSEDPPLSRPLEASRRRELASAIQQAVEAWLAAHELPTPEVP